ncbi:MFS transporter [Streptomyces sp. CB01881]|uniref:MFS transporter n=1 Tax=Streptomyces sp. CB01881 TaxID=2078691 RepID=UPI000CDC54E0|nr:MFS transporter [Streptomyces sp. CB01881]AUY50938.1 MFS transporter [Streptomyces sp. CB01881]TYC74322.1 MFS transporter [Streptomyces sp. CB01881]
MTDAPAGSGAAGTAGTAQSAPAAAAAAEPESLWRNRDFLTFWLGETVSLLGTQITNLALPLTAIRAFHATDEQVGLLRFLQLVPYLGLALLIGVWTDRVRRRPVMLGANLVRLVLLSLVPLLYWWDALDLPVLLVIACAVGVASVVFDVSWMSYVPVLVRDPGHYVEASARMGTSSSAADVAGPGLAGVLVSALSAPVALVVDACSYAVSVVSLLLIRTPEPRPEPAAERHLLRELRDGLGWVMGSGVLRALALIGFCCNFSMVTVWTMFLLHGTNDLHLTSTTLGAVFATASVGGLIGALVSRRVIARFPTGRVYLVAQSALLLGPTLIALAAGPRPVMVSMFVLSFFTTYLGLGVAGVVIVSLRQALTPQSMMGRMTAAFRTLLFGGGALGGLSAGLLAGRIGAEGALRVAAAGSALVVIGLVVSPVSRLRSMPLAPPEEPRAAGAGG